MKKILIAIFLIALSLHAAKEEILLNSANAYVLTMQKISHKNALVERAKAILIFPTVKKVGFIIGGLYGEGVVMIKNGSSWKINKAEITNASIGFQIGYEDNYVVLFVMNDKTLQSMLKAEMKLGADATASIWKASASVGSIDVFDKDIYAYMSKTGAFAGASLGGFVLNIDKSVVYNHNSYGYKNLLDVIERD
ncbi:lipid-binding SYLF domain-containing protein [Campylobacter geochelonis]|uniref:Uncharacterized conserved protein n=1 Tax=Campylobacter geochelonis TaxID=1780362 RepID=A0A128EJK1_9BACT|nr:lipid-binding SYLF domain-containing protein [Campylobacter geochelonis]QKF71712.1 putative lipid-binding protein (SYLF/DUF500 domain) [Campylobacter geochelonis]CZE47679.1 Uncharacterized conserved protein [Campylobacter geochelonis]CZE48582.1 Uncharacterized conserved protein [Campylobacter geochelonis]CZE51130.1 Uncharacterized conserved protein [Campylobacter geochelonis]